MATLEEINREIAKLRNKQIVLDANRQYGNQKFKAQKELFFLKAKVKFNPIIMPLKQAGQTIKQTSQNIQKNIVKNQDRFSNERLRKILGV